MPILANPQGQIQGTFTVPPQIPTGTKLVQFVGNQGSYGQTTYTGKGTITNEERRRVTLLTDTFRSQTSVVFQRYDPLAQTFTLNESRHIGGVDLWFANAGKSRVVVQLRDTSLGLPNQVVLAEGFILPTDIKTGGTSTRITWSPVWCDAGHEYALVLLTDDADTAVQVAELGKYDAVHSRWITSQPYQIGVLLSSSNASTWTPHQTLDLTFRLLAVKFTETTRTIDLGQITAKNTSDLIVLANIERVSVATDADFTITDQNGVTLHLADDLPTTLRARLSGPLTVKALLRGSDKASPVVYPGIQMVMGDVAETADYVTRSIPAGTNVTVTITYEAMTPGTSDVKVYLQQTDGSWQSIALTTGKPIDEQWSERTHTLTKFTADSVRIKLVLTGSTLYRPGVRSLRVVVI